MIKHLCISELIYYVYTVKISIFLFLYYDSRNIINEKCQRILTKIDAINIYSIFLHSVIMACKVSATIYFSCMHKRANDTQRIN